MFTRIQADNFFSWETLDFNFHSGVTLVSGFNSDDNTSEGSGKSTCFEALVWCLFGTCSKDVLTDEVIRTGSKGCSVIVTLEDGTQLIRTRKPNDTYIKINDTIKRGRDARETQKLINELIGMNFNTFMNTVYFAQNYVNKFITATQEDKAKILSELQDLSIFDRASVSAKEKLKEIGFVDLVQLNSAQRYQTEKLYLIESQLTTFDELSNNFHSNQLKELDEITRQHDRILKEVQDIENVLKTLTNLDSLSATIKSLEATEYYLQECQQKLYLINNMKLQKLKALENKICPTCGQEIHNVSGLPNMEIPDDNELLEQEAFLKLEVATLQKDVEELTWKNTQNTLLIQKLSYLNQQRDEVKNDLLKLENMNNPYIEKIQVLTLEQEATNKALALVNDQLLLKQKEVQYLEFLKKGFKEIKSYVFQSLLVELNTKTNRYLRDLFELPASIVFDNVSEEGEISKITTTVILDGIERSLGLLSGGQFRRVQLAVDFALSEIVAERATKPINFRILDESFKDLSFPSMEKVVDILKQMKGCTILIEHSELVKNIVNRVYHVELKNGVSAHVDS